MKRIPWLLIGSLMVELPLNAVLGKLMSGIVTLGIAAMALWGLGAIDNRIRKLEMRLTELEGKL